LHVAGEALEHLADDSGGLLGRVLEEDVIAIGDLNEVVSASAGLGGWRFCVSRSGWGTRMPVASVEMQKAFFIASWRIASTTVAPQVAPACSVQRHIEPRSMGHTEARESIFLTVQRGSPVAVFVGCDVRDQRGRGDRARKHLGAASVR